MRRGELGLGLLILCLIAFLIGLALARADDVVTAEWTGTLGTMGDSTAWTGPTLPCTLRVVSRPCDTITDSLRGEVEGSFPIKCFYDPAYYYPLVEQKCDTFKYEDVTCIWCHPDTTWHRKVAVWMTPDEWLIWKTIKEKR